MKKIALVAALPFALTLTACGETAEETDTTSMEADAVAPMDSTTTDPMVGTDTMTEEPMTDDMATDPAMDPAMDPAVDPAMDPATPE